MPPAWALDGDWTVWTRGSTRPAGLGWGLGCRGGHVPAYVPACRSIGSE
jgi:hypothetical protein